MGSQILSGVPEMIRIMEGNVLTVSGEIRTRAVDLPVRPEKETAVPIPLPDHCRSNEIFLFKAIAEVAFFV